MLTFILKRLASAVLTLFVVSALTFSLAHLAGDPAIAVAGKEASAEDVARIRAHYGFDRSVAEQYLGWCIKALTGDFGTSYHYQQRVSELIAAHLPITIVLALASLVFTLVLSLPLGVVSAVHRNSLIDRLCLVLTVVGQAMPTFWLALLMIVFFSLTFRWLPVSGTGSWKNFVMPTIALGFFAMPVFMRLVRVGMIDALDSDYIRTAWAKGLKPNSVLFKHALRNVLIPIVSVSAVQLGTVLAGSIVVEQIFALRGIGWLGYDATVRSDLPVLQAITIVIASFYVLLTLGADLLNAMLDPRIRIE